MISETSQQIQRRIVETLRNGGLNHYQIASEINHAPFRVRAELKALRRERLVRDHVAPREIVWELTSLGYEAAYAGEQLTIDQELTR